MINHVRTLLLNEAAPAAYDDGAELVDPTFRPVRLPTDLAAARSLLFGPGADRFGRSVTLQRLLAVARSLSTLSALLVEADPRLALRHPAPAVPAPDVSDPAGSVVAPTDPFPEPGRGSGRWTVRRSGGAWTVAPEAAPPVTVTAVAGGGFATIPLTGSRASAVLTDADGTTVVRLWSAPTHDFTAVAGCDPAAVFRPGASDADRALYDTWRTGALGCERAAAAALALARRIDALRGT